MCRLCFSKPKRKVENNNRPICEMHIRLWLLLLHVTPVQHERCCFLCENAAVQQANADWRTWILHTECVNSGWTPGCTVSGTLWQPRPNDPARDCTVHREVLHSRTATLLLPSTPPSPSILPLLSASLNLFLHAVFLSSPSLRCYHAVCWYLGETAVYLRTLILSHSYQLCKFPFVCDKHSS